MVKNFELTSATISFGAREVEIKISSPFIRNILHKYTLVILITIDES